MESSPPCACCPPNSEPLRLMKDYKPRGEMVTISANTGSRSVPCYVARPAGSTSRAVIMFSDVFGVHTGRHKQFCDDLAEDGFLAVCPDFFAEAPYMKNPPAFGTTTCCMVTFICGALVTKSFRNNTKKHHTWGGGLGTKVKECVLPWLAKQGATDFASVGFCWGSYGAQKCGALPGFKCCASFHPSTEGFCKDVGEDDLQVCREVKCPQLVVATSLESDRWKPDNVAHKATEEATPGKVIWKFEKGESHGYMTRGDTKKPETMEAVKRGYQEMVSLFKANMS